MMQRPLRRDEIVESIRFVVPGTVTIFDEARPNGKVARDGSIEVVIRIDETGQSLTARVLTVTP